MTKKQGFSRENELNYSELLEVTLKSGKTPKKIIKNYNWISDIISHFHFELYSVITEPYLPFINTE